MPTEESLDNRIQVAVAAAEDAFWEEIARRFPECKTGDLSPGTTFKLRAACTEAVQEWTSVNH